MNFADQNRGADDPDWDPTITVNCTLTPIGINCTLTPIGTRLQPIALIEPRIEYRCAGPGVILGVAGHDGEVVVKAGRRDDEIGLGIGMPGLASVLHQQPPFQHDVFADRQDATVEHRSDFVGQPVLKFGAPIGVGYQLDSEANFRERDRTEIEKIERLRGDKP